MAKARGLLTEYEAPWSAPYGTPVMDEAVRSGMQRLRTAGKRSGLKPNDRLFNAALLQDVVMGAGEVVGAPLTGLMAPAMPYVKKAAEFAGRMPSMEAIGPRGGWTGDGGKRPATMGEGVKGLLKTATKGVDKVAEATGYPKEYTREAALAGAGLLAGPAAKFAGKAGGLLEKGLNRVGLTAKTAANQANMFVPVTKKTRPPKVMFEGQEMDAVDAAERMRELGYPEAQIWADAGVERHPVHGGWRWEVSDRPARLTKSVPELLAGARAMNERTAQMYKEVGQPVPANAAHTYDLAEVMHHPTLYKELPELARGVRVVLDPDSVNAAFERGGSHPNDNIGTIYLGTKGKTDDQIMDDLIHEVQHSVQHGSKGWSTGSSPAHDPMYEFNAGEVEARNAASRRKLKTDERREYYPGHDPDFGKDGQSNEKTPPLYYQHDTPYSAQVMGRPGGYREVFSSRRPSFTEMARRGQLRQARTEQQDLEDLLAGKMAANDFDLTSSDDFGNDYETGAFTDRLKKAGLHVEDDMYGRVYAGRDKAAVAALKGAKTPADYGRAYGYSDDDIARFYLERNGGDAKAAQREFERDMGVQPGPVTRGANGGGILNVRSARKQGITPTTKNTQRIAFPGIYKHPNELTDDAAALVAPESPALKGLFGVTRDDLYQMSKGRKGNVDATVIFPAGARGSEAAGNVITDKNARRLVDAMSVAEQRAPQLTNPMDAWYVMDPAFRRLEQLVGKEEAIRRYNDLNAFTSMASPASDVITEMNRGTTANYLNRRGRFGDFEAHSTTPVGKRGGDFPVDISGLKPHPYGGTAHSQPMRKYVDGGLLDNGFLNVQTSKVPTYHMASGVPETGFQTNVPVGDAHFARAIGLPDVRNMLTLKGKPVIPQANATMPEISTLTPWWQQKVVGPLGIESVPGQARAWGLFSPQSGVDTPIGAPKLELLAAEIEKLALQAGVDPAQLRDAILMGDAGLGNNPAMLQGLLSKR